MLKNIFDFLFGSSEKQLARAFELGVKNGYRNGVIDGMAKNFERSEQLPEAEYREVMQYLAARGLELCCYDIERGGFRVQKRLYHGR